MEKIGVLGSGAVGETLANGFLKLGHSVMRGSREPSKLEKWRAGAGLNASIGTFADTAKYGDVVVLAVKGVAAEAVLEQAGIASLAGKTVIDTTNPISEKAPVHGVLSYFTSLDESLMERLQRKAPQAKLVKAFSCVGNALMVNPDFGHEKPSMFICGNDLVAKRKTTEILQRFGWEVEDMGAVEAARAIEPLCILWCIPGFIEKRWTHAFKLLKK